MLSRHDGHGLDEDALDICCFQSLVFASLYPPCFAFTHIGMTERFSLHRPAEHRSWILILHLLLRTKGITIAWALVAGNIISRNLTWLSRYGRRGVLQDSSISLGVQALVFDCYLSSKDLIRALWEALTSRRTMFEPSASIYSTGALYVL